MASIVAAPASVSRAAASCGRMAAWRVHAYGGLGELRLEAARVPPLRAPDQLLVRVEASSVNPIDVAMIGGYGRRALGTWRRLEGGDGVEFPLIGGRDFCGRVERAGPAARLPRGARVWGVLPPHWPGAHAQFAVVRDCWAGPKPPRLGTLAAGGALYAALTATAALRAAGLPAAGGAAEGARVLVLGLGGVAQAALRLLAAARAHAVVGCAADAREAAARLGAAAALDRHAADYEERLRGAGPFDAVLDCAGLGGREAAARGWRFARYVTLTTPLLRETDAAGALGAAAAAAELAGQCAAAAAAARRDPAPAPAVAPAPAPARLLPPHVRWAFFTPSQEDIELLYRLAERGLFDVTVERSWGWREGAAAYARMADGHARGKLLLDFRQD